ncbi:hypothetical protein KVR01_010268 [Diaporthe batatas]|uniref:uncharacterized protein n=1 Tax=Diaporthe batatas TaxID=748121 RepID=UPI001D040E30|nr:uncharacterized protein KVR01_010268 [Diaporthe batatas]KAG8159631.1 hypothetical protein KVR01_010268 [Diaporthe batatas]
MTPASGLTCRVPAKGSCCAELQYRICVYTPALGLYCTYSVIRSTIPSLPLQLTRHDFTAQPVDKPHPHATARPLSFLLLWSALNRHSSPVRRLTFPFLQGWGIPAGTLAHVMTLAPFLDLD